MGRFFAHSSMMSLTVLWVSTIWCSRDPSESIPKTFKNKSGGSSATFWESLTTSDPGSLDNVLAGVLTFPAMWMILKS